MAEKLPLTIIPERDALPPAPPSQPAYGLKIIAAVLILLLAGAGGYFFYQHNAAGRDIAAALPAEGQLNRQNPPGIPAPSRYSDSVVLIPGQNSPEQEERKAEFGLDKSLDIIVRSDESIVVNDAEIPVAELERQLDLYRGEISEQHVNPSQDQISAWGVHLVRAKDNLWLIHLNLLREYMAGRGITMAQGADQPLPSGYSSDVGKMLKFAEHMVGVFNLRTRQMSHDLNWLEPGEKIAVFNLSEIFSQLQNADLNDLRCLIYDGRVLIFPQKHQP
ncbi:MAG: hypothetical protein LBJ14_02995 [Desulfarculales bacterium]|jgi:hypothetical protein|nr:hypothetical protein [Desulfarculales bacterium]